MSCTIWLNCLDKMTIIDLHSLSGTERQKDNNNSIVFETFNRVESSIYERHNVLIHGSKTRYIPKSKLDRVNNLLNCMCENNRQIIKRRHLYDNFVVNDNDNSKRCSGFQTNGICSPMPETRFRCSFDLKH